MKLKSFHIRNFRKKYHYFLSSMIRTVTKNLKYKLILAAYNWAMACYRYMCYKSHGWNA